MTGAGPSNLAPPIGRVAWRGGWANHGRRFRPTAAIRRDGRRAVYSGIAHDLRAQLRAVALFDHAGEHSPTSGETWLWRGHRLDDDQTLKQGLARFGVHVREPGQRPWARPPQ